MAAKKPVRYDRIRVDQIAGPGTDPSKHRPYGPPTGSEIGGGRAPSTVQDLHVAPRGVPHPDTPPAAQQALSEAHAAGAPATAGVRSLDTNVPTSAPTQFTPVRNRDVSRTGLGQHLLTGTGVASVARGAQSHPGEPTNLKFINRDIGPASFDRKAKAKDARRNDRRKFIAVGERAGATVDKIANVTTAQQAPTARKRSSEEGRPPSIAADPGGRPVSKPSIITNRTRKAPVAAPPTPPGAPKPAPTSTKARKTPSVKAAKTSVQAAATAVKTSPTVKAMRSRPAAAPRASDKVQDARKRALVSSAQLAAARDSQKTAAPAAIRSTKPGAHARTPGAHGRKPGVHGKKSS